MRNQSKTVIGFAFLGLGVAAAFSPRRIKTTQHRQDDVTIQVTDF